MSEIYEIHDSVLRENKTPREGHEGSPTWLVILALATMAVAGYYLGAESAGFRGDVIELQEPTAVGASAEPEPVDPLVLGKRRYAACTRCHQADGRGLPPQFPPLAGSDWVNGNPERLVKILLHGLEGPIEVNGVRYSGQMPRWLAFSDVEIASVLTYIRGEWGNDSPPIEPALVEQIRAEHDGRSRAWTNAELEAAQ